MSKATFSRKKMVPHPDLPEHYPEYVFGIDPGRAGACTFIHGLNGLNNERPEILAAHDMQTCKIPGSSTWRTDVVSLAGFLVENLARISETSEVIVHAVIENVTAMPRTQAGKRIMNSSSQWQLARSLGAIEACLALIVPSLTVYRVQPAVWKKHYPLINTNQQGPKNKGTTSKKRIATMENFQNYLEYLDDPRGVLAHKDPTELRSDPHLTGNALEKRVARAEAGLIARHLQKIWMTKNKP